MDVLPNIVHILKSIANDATWGPANIMTYLLTLVNVTIELDPCDFLHWPIDPS